jgi:hypothetical protein
MSGGREDFATIYDPLVMGVDVARFGDDRSVIRFRRGRDGRPIPPIKLRGVDTTKLAARVVDENARHRCAAIYRWGRRGCRPLPTAQGAGDRGAVWRQIRLGAGRRRWRCSLTKPTSAPKCGGTMREWLRGGAIDNDGELRAQLWSTTTYCGKAVTRSNWSGKRT